MQYPKVLLLGEPFNDYSGMGITLTNLFHDWPKENIAVASYNLDVGLCEKLRPCAQYVPLGGVASSQLLATRQSHRKKGLKSILRANLGRLYSKLGLSDLRHIPVTSSLLDCIESFCPDIILSALGSLDRIKFCEEVKYYAPDAKLALYVVDDWPNTKFNGRLCQWWWRKKYDVAYRRILAKADVCMSICQYMSDAYIAQYGVKFYPFHNPVEVSKWDAIEKMRKYEEGVFSVLYVGKINRDTQQPLKDLCETVTELNRNGEKVVFDIYSPNLKHDIDLSKYKGCNIYSQVPNAEIPQLMKSYDALFLTLGFSEISRKYVRLSMPTKLTEYLVSGIPILLYCPEEIALSKYVSTYGAAVVCNQPDKRVLQQYLLNMIHSDEYNECIVNRARDLSLQHDVQIVRERFRKTLSSVI